MKIQTITTQQVVTDTEIETPAFFKVYEHGVSRLYRLNSEEDLVQVTISANLTSVSRHPLRLCHDTEKIFAGERIGLHEFNNALIEATYKINIGVPGEEYVAPY